MVLQGMVTRTSANPGYRDMEGPHMEVHAKGIAALEAADQGMLERMREPRSGNGKFQQPGHHRTGPDGRGSPAKTTTLPFNAIEKTGTVEHRFPFVFYATCNPFA